MIVIVILRRSTENGQFPCHTIYLSLVWSLTLPVPLLRKHTGTGFSRIYLSFHHWNRSRATNQGEGWSFCTGVSGAGAGLSFVRNWVRRMYDCLVSFFFFYRFYGGNGVTGLANLNRTGAVDGRVSGHGNGDDTDWNRSGSISHRCKQARHSIGGMLCTVAYSAPQR